MPMARTGFWVFVSNPRRFPIDRLMRERLPKDAKDSWTVRKSDVFEPGDFGLVRTVVPARENKRTEAQLKEDGASEQLASGIYAVCEVLSKNRPWANKMNEDLWRSPEETKLYSQSKTWQMVDLNYLWWCLANPLLVSHLKSGIPDLRSPNQGQHCFPIPKDHFRKIVDCLHLPDAIRDVCNAKADH
jgi:hypothetical protein